MTRAGIDVEQLVLEPLAAAESVLTDDDKEYGCAVREYGVGDHEPDDLWSRGGAAYGRFSVRQHACLQRI